MKKVFIVLNIFFILVIILIQIAFARENNNNEENIYVYERDLISNETTVREIIDTDCMNESISMKPYKEEDNIEEMISPTAIIGPDNRNIVDTSQNPFKSIGYLDIENGKYRGTAFLVDDNIVVTAAHCVVGYNGMKFFPGSKTNSHPYGEANVTRYIWAGPNNYTGDGDFEDDWAILILDKPIGNTCGWLGVSNMTEYPNGPSGWVGLLANVSGYPADLGYDQYHAVGNIVTATDKILTINTDAMGGNSGSPVYKYNSGYYAYGIFTGEYNGSNPYNVVTRINNTVYNAIIDAKNRY